MKGALLLLAVFLTLNLQGQNWWGNGIKGEGPIVKKTLKVADFKGFVLATSGNVYLRQGSNQSVEVESHQNIIDNIVTDLEEGIWKIKFKNPVSRYDKFNVYITVPTLTKAAISGSGDIKGETPFKGLGAVTLSISGSGDLMMEVEGESVDAKISGSGDINVKGKAKSLKAAISGSGDIVAEYLNVADAAVSISGSGDVSVNASENLNVQTSGSGDVSYRGRPRVQSRVSGSGSLTSKQ